MDAAGWQQVVQVVVATLSEYDPEHAAEYAANAAVYQAELVKLDAYAKARVQTIPEQQRLLVTAHDAFNYFGRAYGLELLGIQGISTESEPGLDDINRLVDTLIERQIQAVFVESSVPEKNVRALIEGAKSRGHEVTVGGELYSDAMGQAGTYEGTYIGMIDHNVTTIVRALGGDAPQAGMQGKLTGVK
jgi:manganese/zinc/iron transport system substrate-binding protein